MSDFSGDQYEFAMGAAYGIRSWGIDDLGRLHGVTHREVWRPGENVAACKATREIPCPDPVRAPQDRLPAIEAPKPKPKKKGRNRRHDDVMAPWERELLYGEPRNGARRCGEPTCYRGVHTVPTDHDFDPDCQCGFWAYNEDAFASHADVSGIIEGYGKTTIGTRGFRSEKARIVALARKRDGSNLSLSTWARLQSLYPDAKFFDTKDEMVTAFDGVIKVWAPVDEGFWDKPVKAADDGMLMTYHSMANALYYPSTTRWVVGS